MKFIKPLLFCTALLFTIPLQAQDLGISHLAHVELSEVKGGDTKRIVVILDVVSAVATGKTFDLKYSIDNGAAATAVTNISFDGTPAGQKVNPIPCPVPFGTNYDDTVAIRIIIDMDDDTDASNDTALIRFIVREKVKNDLKLTLLSPKSGDDLAVDKPHDFTYSIKNVGTTNLVEGGNQLLEYISLNGVLLENPSFSAYEGDTLKPGDSLEQVLTFTFPAIQQGQSLRLCNNVFWAELTDTSLNSIEGNHSDNSACADFNLVANSILEINQEPFIESLSLANGNLRIAFTETLSSKENVQLEVVSADGKTLFNQNIDYPQGNQDFAMPSLHNGLYLVRIHTNGYVPQLYKVIHM